LIALLIALTFAASARDTDITAEISALPATVAGVEDYQDRYKHIFGMLVAVPSDDAETARTLSIALRLLKTLHADGRDDQIPQALQKLIDGEPHEIEGVNEISRGAEEEDDAPQDDADRGEAGAVEDDADRGEAGAVEDDTDPASAVALQPDSGMPPADELATLSFSTLVFLDRESGVYGGSTDQGVWLLVQDQLRDAGLNVVGAEDLLFGESRPGRFLLGGLAERQRVGSDGKRLGVELVIRWKLYDNMRKVVVYEVTTRGFAPLDHHPSQNEAWREALRQTLHSAIERTHFVDALRLRPRAGDAVATTEDLRVRRCQVPAVELPRAVDSVLDATATVVNGSSHGSGVFISPDGHLLTAAHVVSQDEGIHIQLHNGPLLPVKLLRIDHAADVALLRVDGTSFSCRDVSVDAPPHRIRGPRVGRSVVSWPFRHPWHCERRPGDRWTATHPERRGHQPG